MTRPRPSADQLVDMFGLTPLPVEGGMLVQTWRSDEVLDSLNKRYNLGIKRDKFKMEQALDTLESTSSRQHSSANNSIRSSHFS